MDQRSKRHNLYIHTYVTVLEVNEYSCLDDLGVQKDFLSMPPNQKPRGKDYKATGKWHVRKIYLQHMTNTGLISLTYQ